MASFSLRQLLANSGALGCPCTSRKTAVLDSGQDITCWVLSSWSFLSPCLGLSQMSLMKQPWRKELEKEMLCCNSHSHVTTVLRFYTSSQMTTALRCYTYSLMTSVFSPVLTPLMPLRIPLLILVPLLIPLSDPTQTDMRIRPFSKSFKSNKDKDKKGINSKQKDSKALVKSSKDSSQTPQNTRDIRTAFLDSKRKFMDSSPDGILMSDCKSQKTDEKPG